MLITVYKSNCNDDNNNDDDDDDDDDDNNNNNNNNSSLLNPSPKLTNLVNQFDNKTYYNNNVNDDFIHSKCYDIDEIQKLKILNKEMFLLTSYKCLFTLQKS